MANLELLIKIGNKHHKTHDRYYTDYRDGIVLRTNTENKFVGRLTRRHFCVITTHLNYTTVMGTDNRKTLTALGKNIKRFHYPAVNGRLPWESGYSDITEPDRTRDWYLDFDFLLDEKIITQSQYDDIFDHEKDPGRIYIDRPLDYYIWHEDDSNKKRKQDKVGIIHKNQGITSGDYTIGDNIGDDYSSIEDFRDDINTGGTLTGDINGLHEDDETDLTDATNWDFDTAAYTMTLKPGVGKGFATGAVRDETKARINYGTYDNMRFNGSDLDDIVVQGLQLDISGLGNTAIYLNQGTGFKILGNIINGDTGTIYGIRGHNPYGTRLIANNLIYNIGNSTGESGISLDSEWGSGTIHIVNNTCINNYENIEQIALIANQSPTVVVKNNLCQDDDGGSDYADGGAGFGTTAYNVSEDTSSPDVSYRSLNCHDGNSCFNNYGSNDFTLVATGDEISTLDDCTDPSLGFTDDIIGTERSAWYIGCFEIASNEVTVTGSETPTGEVARTFYGQRIDRGNI